MINKLVSEVSTMASTQIVTWNVSIKILILKFIFKNSPIHLFLFWTSKKQI